ncbi:hypothetical protein C8J57DRAFT_1256781 [Mycena rebaudengoi]|nr:hypothetical protein C8J57DRAFT_1256781 [Mycena rebaudengoi]
MTGPILEGAPVYGPVEKQRLKADLKNIYVALGMDLKRHNIEVLVADIKAKMAACPDLAQTARFVWNYTTVPAKKAAKAKTSAHKVAEDKAENSKGAKPLILALAFISALTLWSAGVYVAYKTFSPFEN